MNSEMRVRGETRETLDLSDLVSSQYRTFLLFPSSNATELNQNFLVQGDRVESCDKAIELEPKIKKPIQLIVPDGNWRQASKVHYRHHELCNVPRVMIGNPGTSKYRLRHEHTGHGMATLEAIAHALGVIEGEAVKIQLMKLYRAKLEATLIGRGQAVGKILPGQN